MADDVNTLILRAKTHELERGTDRLAKLERQAGATERASDRLASGLKRMALAVASVATVTATLRKMTSAARSFDVMNAQLKTATGSAENAAIAFQAITEFAATTPFQLDEVTNAFVKMRNMGLDPGEAALTSYGNTASAMGKSLNQMIEAVADAATFEFERLKEFGIKARQEKDSVNFTFQGVTTSVAKNSEAIVQYLRDIGDENFAGAMADRMDTLDGALSNLEDSWNQMWMKAGQNGAAAETERLVRELIELLNDPDTIKAVGALGNAIIRTMSGAAEAIRDTINVTEFLAEELASMIHGPALDDLPRITDRLAELDAEIAKLEGQSGGGRMAAGRNSRLAELRAEAEQLRGALRAMADNELQAITTTAQRLPVPEAATGDRLTGYKVPTPDEEGGGSAVTARRQAELDKLRESFMTEEQLQKAHHQNRLSDIQTFLDEKLIAEAEARSMREQAELEHEQRLQEIRDEKWNREHQWMQDGLSLAEAYYSGMEGKEAAFARAGIQAAKLLMDAKKRTALINATVKGYEGIQEAVASAPFPANVPAVAYATGQMAVNVGGIAGARALGGQVRGGESYIVGERGPELLTMGSTGGKITPNDKMGGGGGGTVVHNHYNNTVEIRAIDTVEGAEWIMENRGAIAGAFNADREDRGNDPL